MLRLEKLKRINLILLIIFVLASCQSSQYQIGDIFSQVFKENVDDSNLDQDLTDQVEGVIHSYKRSQPIFKTFTSENALENIRLGVSNDPRVLSKLAALEMAKEDINISESFNKLQTSANLTGGLRTEDRTSEAAAAVVISSNKVLYDFGMSEAQLRIASDSLELARLDTLMKAEEVGLNGIDIWVSFVKQKQINKIYKDGLALAKPLLGQIENISVSGVADKTELLAAKEKYSRLQNGANQAQSLFNAAETEFFNFFNVSDVPKVEMLEGMVFPDSLISESGKIMKSNLVQYQILSEKILIEKMKALEGKDKPLLSFSSQVMAPAKDTLDEGTLNAGLLVNYVFNDGGRNKAEIKKVEAEIISLNNKSTSVYFDLSKQFLLLEEEYKANQKKKALMKELNDLAKEVRDTAKAQLISGRSSIKDVMNAEVSLAESQVELIIADADLITGSYRANAISGDFLPYIGWNIPQ